MTMLLVHIENSEKPNCLFTVSQHLHGKTTAASPRTEKIRQESEYAVMHGNGMLTDCGKASKLRQAASFFAVRRPIAALDFQHFSCYDPGTYFHLLS